MDIFNMIILFFKGNYVKVIARFTSQQPSLFSVIPLFLNNSCLKSYMQSPKRKKLWQTGMNGYKFVLRLNIPLYESNDVSYHKAKLEVQFVFTLESFVTVQKKRFLPSVSSFPAFKDNLFQIEQMRIKRLRKK